MLEYINHNVWEKSAGNCGTAYYLSLVLAANAKANVHEKHWCASPGFLVAEHFNLAILASESQHRFGTIRPVKYGNPPPDYSSPGAD